MKKTRYSAGCEGLPISAISFWAFPGGRQEKPFFVFFQQLR
jgi:hypothetical protein